MSYIRSGSNPESLYIHGDKEGTVHISMGTDHTRKIPRNVFHGLIRKYHKMFNEDVSFKGASLTERWVKCDGRNECKTVLAYDDWECIMWGVTWDYIAYTNLENINRNAKSKIVVD